MCATSFVYVAGIAAMLCAKVSSLADPVIDCSKDKPQWAENVAWCKAELDLKMPKADFARVKYGNAGYLRSYGTQMSIECLVTLNINYTNSTNSSGHITVEVFYEDVTNHHKSPRVLPEITDEFNEYRYYTTTFLVAHPKPGAEYRCFCAFEFKNHVKNHSKFCLEAQMVMGGIQRFPATLPCRHETCRQSRDERMCYENYATGDIHHTWSNNLFTLCPAAADLFEHKCQSLLNSTGTSLLNDGLQFYLDGSVVDSGSLYNVFEGESVALSTSSCLPHTSYQLRSLECNIMAWSMDKPIWLRHFAITKGLILMPQRKNSNPQCVKMHIDINYVDLPYKTRDGLLVVGCHTDGRKGPQSVKQIEFYINILNPITHSNVDQSCSLEFDGQWGEVHYTTDTQARPREWTPQRYTTPKLELR